MKKRVILIVVFLIPLMLQAKKYEFIFLGFKEKKLRIKWEVFTTEPTGFDDQKEITFEQGKDVFTVNLDKNQSIRFGAYASNNLRLRSLVETRHRNQLSRKSSNQILFTTYKQKDPQELLSLPQLLVKVSQDKFANGLTKEKEDMIIDTDLPVGTLIFFDGNNSYYRPTSGIIDREEQSEILNEYDHKLEDLIRIEQGFNLGASSSQLGFIKNLTAGIDISNTKFFEYRIEINNLSKRQANSYLKDPFDIFKDKNDRWLEAAYNLVNSNEDKSKYKLYFVMSRTLSDAVYMRRRVYKEFKGDFSVIVDGGELINVEGGGTHYSLASFEKLDSIRNYYVNYEVIDMSLVLHDEATKRLTEKKIDAVEQQKEFIINELNESRQKLIDNYDLLKLYSTELPQSVGKVNQVISICKDRAFKLEKSLPVDTLGKEIHDATILAHNRNVVEYNKYLSIIQDEIKVYEDKIKVKKSIEGRIYQLQNNLELEQYDKPTEIVDLDAKVVKNLKRGTPQ